MFKSLRTKVKEYKNYQQNDFMASVYFFARDIHWIYSANQPDQSCSNPKLLGL